ncbi:hypothetical protein D0Z07_5803 [Hyphodiscus hymeniophilus]|uniref:NADH-ubiquinone oxidoreductase 17.8 kDa subunit n=1 Tax=Hyphodiscus hymeniophilus TaxID=353542 RepID=A0A9P6VHD2_9HELO|nr:hypothetical protein D0Z07_5803 [Hyphodiscus hymeniophilus]
MYALGRQAVESASRLSAVTTRTGRRHASGHAHGHHEGPKNESLGTLFYIALAAVPVTIGVYTAAQKTPDGKATGLSTLIDKYSDYKEKWAARNTLHTSMIEQAAFDRNLYQSSPGTKHVDLRFPEVFNTGSPYNVSAGQRARNMDELVAHYEKKNAGIEEKRAKASEEKKN